MKINNKIITEKEKERGPDQDLESLKKQIKIDFF